MTPLRAHLPHGVELHFVEAGCGQPIVLLHGGIGDCEAWPSQVEALSRQFRVISFSRRHSSPNRNPDPGTSHSLDDDVQDLDALLALLQAGCAHLVGTSYGALVALSFALQRPLAVASLVLCEPPLHAWACRTPAGRSLFRRFLDEAWRPARAMFDRGEDARAMQLLVDAMAGRPVFDALPLDRVASALRNRDAMATLTRADDPFPYLPREQVGALAMPVLLLRGEHTSALHAHVMDELASALPHAQASVIPAAGHAAPSENPQAFNACVLSFLASHGVPPAAPVSLLARPQPRS
jgi:pimeloyl-ACP methyl ester carboxylesterase